MVDYIFEIAKKFQDKIDSDVTSGFRFGNAFNDAYMDQYKLSEEMSQSDLNYLNNQFGITERMQNWDSDLEGSRWESLYTAKSNRSKYEDYDAIRAYEAKKRELDLRTAERDLQMFDQTTIDMRLESERKSIENESMIQKYQNDKKMEEIKSQVDPFMPEGEKYKVMIRIAKETGASPNVISRINEEFLTNNREMFDIAKVTSNLLKQYEYISKQPQTAYTRAQLAQLENRIIGGLSVTDISIAEIASANGMLSVEDLGYLKKGLQPLQNQMIEAEQSVATTPSTPAAVTDAAAPIPGQEQSTEQPVPQIDNNQQQTLTPIEYADPPEMSDPRTQQTLMSLQVQLTPESFDIIQKQEFNIETLSEDLLLLAGAMQEVVRYVEDNHPLLSAIGEKYKTLAAIRDSINR